MHLGDKLAALHERIGKHVEVRERIRLLGVIPSTKRRGWLSIEDWGDRWKVLWTRCGRGAYDPARDGEATVIHVRKSAGGENDRIDGMNEVWHGRPPMPQIRTEDDVKRILRQMQRFVDIAYTFHVTQPWIAKPDLIPNVGG